MSDGRGGESPGLPHSPQLPGEMSPFANCSGFGENQINILAALRGGTSAVAAVATFMFLVVTCAYQSRFGREIENKWLKIFLFALFGVSITYLTVLSLGVVYHFLPDPSAGRWCAAFGFFDQVLSVIQITLLFIVIMVVFRPSGQDGNISGRKKWVWGGIMGTVIALAVVIVTASFVPFIHGTYGEVGGWCWIVSINEGCEVLVVGLIEQLFLWIIYHALISLICILIVLKPLILFVRACIQIRSFTAGEYESLDDRHNFRHILCKYIFQLIIFVPIFVDFVDFVLVGHIHRYSFILWVLFATAPAISGFLVPFSFLLYMKFGNDGFQNNVNSPENAQNHAPANRNRLHPTADLRAENTDQRPMSTHTDPSSFSVLPSALTTTSRSSGFDTATESQSETSGFETAVEIQSVVEDDTEQLEGQALL